MKFETAVKVSRVATWFAWFVCLASVIYGLWCIFHHPVFVAKMVRVPGPSALTSRCRDCTQAGDFIHVTMLGDDRRVHGVRVYDGDTLVTACAPCSALTFTVRFLGRYDIVAYEAPNTTACIASNAGLDSDVAGLQRCGADITPIHFEAR